MTVSRADLIRLVTPDSGNRLVHRFMRDVEPLCRIAEDGVLRLSESSRLNEASVAKAIASASREEVSGIIAVSAKTDKLGDGIHHEDAYESFLALSLRCRRRDDFVAAHGEEALTSLYDRLWSCLCQDLVAATRRSHGDFLDSVHYTLAHDVAYGASLAVAYGAAYVSQGDEEKYAEMRGLIRLLPWVLPIGAPLGSGGTWLVLVE